jgi:multimeric flavodoxin WrbA
LGLRVLRKEMNCNMSLMIFNGSPRGESSNSDTIISWFNKGYESTSVVYLKKVKQQETFIKESKSFEKLLFVFPLYVDGMPAQVKCFFELMSERKEEFENKEVAFIIHSGFTEAIHCKNLEKYLYRFADSMAMKTYGVFIIPGSEGFRIIPPKMMAKKAGRVEAIGRAYRTSKPFPKDAKIALEGSMAQTRLKTKRFRFMKKAGLSNVYWNRQLKQNDAFDKRFDAPYSK